MNKLWVYSTEEGSGIYELHSVIAVKLSCSILKYCMSINMQEPFRFAFYLKFHFLS